MGNNERYVEACPHAVGVAALVMSSPETVARDANNDGTFKTNGDGVWRLPVVNGSHLEASTFPSCECSVPPEFRAE
jgi:hypothetical protein